VLEGGHTLEEGDVRPFRLRLWYRAIWSTAGLFLLVTGIAVAGRALQAAKTIGNRQSCTSVNEAIALSSSYRFESMSYQVLVADETGEAAIISPRDGRMQIREQSDDAPYLVASTVNAATRRSVGHQDAFRHLRTARHCLSSARSA
jgi:hypothetical protein